MTDIQEKEAQNQFETPNKDPQPTQPSNGQLLQINTEKWDERQIQRIQNPVKLVKNGNTQSQFYLPQLKYQKRRPWNGRFHISSLNNMTKAHPYYRSYFDKPERRNLDKLLKPNTQDRRMEQPMEMARSSSQAVFSKQMIPQSDWNQYFSKMSSKNNEKVHVNYKEFFDKPINYSPQGYMGTMEQAPMQVYNKLSPKGKQIARVTTTDFYKSQRADRFLSTNKSVAQLEDREILQLRTSQSPVDKKKEAKWNERLAFPISNFNEKVHKRYRLPFESL